MYFSESEQQELVQEGKTIEEEGHGDRRWSEYMTTVVQTDDGKFYRVSWDRGLTENQDNTYQDGDVPEVFPVKSLSVYSETLYLTEGEQTSLRPTLAGKMLSEGEAYSIAVGKKINEPITDAIYEKTKDLLESIDELKPLDFVAGSGAYREATKQFLEAIVELREGSAKDNV